jgi:DnaJ-class molecular chaperone
MKDGTDGESIVCPDCAGSGMVVVSLANNDGGIIHDEELDACDTCGGSGEIEVDADDIA